MEMAVRAALLDWLGGDPLLAGAINGFVEEAPGRVALPWLGIAASAASDWSTKTETGREVRLALELHGRGERPGDLAGLVAAIEARVRAWPRVQAGFVVAGVRFLRSRVAQREAGVRAVLLEYRVRVLVD